MSSDRERRFRKISILKTEKEAKRIPVKLVRAMYLPGTGKERQRLKLPGIRGGRHGLGLRLGLN